MHAFSPRVSCLVLAWAACAALSGCTGLDQVSLRITDSITPYRAEVVQGNFVSKEQVSALKPGMSRQQVRDILGTPLLASVFHADRWDYVFTLKRKDVPRQERKLALFFKNNLLDRYEGDEMPTEAEFVATLDNKRKEAKIPVLEASEESLKQFSSSQPQTAAQPAAGEPAPATIYPPLEPLR